MTDFIVELPPKPSHLDEFPREGQWILHVDGVSRAFSSGVGLILQSPIEKLLEQAIRLSFFASNNEAEYEIVLVELDLTLTLVVTKLEICSDSQLIVEQIQKKYEVKDEHMVRYLTLVEGRLKRLDEWTVRHIP